jgi:hypothetical protein
MRYTTFFTGLLITLSLLLAGCATPIQQSVELGSSVLKSPQRKVAVVMSELPKPDTFFPGADCLLCIATASIANRSMTLAVQSWSNDEIAPVKHDVQALLRSWGHEAIVVNEPLKISGLPDRQERALGFAKKDFSAIQQRTGADSVLVVDVQKLGVQRSYSAYFPNGPAMAVLRAEAYLVDLKTHRLDWYDNVDLARQAQGKWDDAPKYPGLTNAYFQLVELAKDRIKAPFKQR